MKDETKVYQTVIKIWMRGRSSIEMFAYGYVIGQTYIYISIYKYIYICTHIHFITPLKNITVFREE